MTLNDREILDHAGTISAKLAKELAESEYEKYRQNIIDIENTKEIKEIEEELRKYRNNESSK